MFLVSPSSGQRRSRRVAADTRAACTAESAGPHHPTPQRAGTPLHDSRAPHQLLLSGASASAEGIGWTGAVADLCEGRRTGALPTADYDQLSASHAAPARRGAQSPHRFARSSSPTRCPSSPPLPVRHRLVRHGRRTARDQGAGAVVAAGAGPTAVPPAALRPYLWPRPCGAHPLLHSPPISANPCAPRPAGWGHPRWRRHRPSGQRRRALCWRPPPPQSSCGQQRRCLRRRLHPS